MLALLFKEWKYVAIAVLSGLLVFTANGWSHTNKLLIEERAAHKADNEKIKDAQVEAEKKIKDVTKQLKEEGEKNAKEADKKYADLYATYRHNLLRYKANQSVPSRPSGSSTGSPAESPNGPSESSELSITVTDAQICAENTARLQTAHDWALGLANGTH